MEAPPEMEDSDICQHLAQDRPFVRFYYGGVTLDEQAKTILLDIIKSWSIFKGDLLISAVMTNRTEALATDERLQATVDFLLRAGIPRWRVWTRVLQVGELTSTALKDTVSLYNPALGEGCYLARAARVARWVERNCIGSAAGGKQETCKKAIDFIATNPP